MAEAHFKARVSRGWSAAVWPVAGALQCYYMLPAAWLGIRRGWSAPYLLILAAGLFSMLLIAGRRSRHLGKLTVLAVALRALTESLTPAVLMLLAHMAKRRPLWQSLILGLAAVAASLVSGLIWGWEQPITVQAWLLGIGVVSAIGIGYGLQQQEKAVAAETARREAALRADEARLEQVRLAERERIAREMHDVVAHRISLVAMASGALAYRYDMSPAEVREAAQLINDNAKRSLDELRLVLSTLRDADNAPAPPQPGIEQVPSLIEESRQAGQHIDLDVQTDLTQVPGQVGRHGFHIVQEALTNARKHAPGSPVEVRLTGSRGEGLLIRVTNPLTDAPRGAGSRLGLVGLAERMELIGGRWSAGKRNDNFAVEAWLPWT